MNEIKNQNDRIAAMGRKPIVDLLPGDEFTHTYYGDCVFVRWTTYGRTTGEAIVHAFGRDRRVALNTAGSVKML